MPIYASKRVLYRVGAAALLPVAGYNLVVGINAAANNTWTNDYMRSLSGGAIVLAVIIALVVLSFTQTDRQIKIWG